MDTEISDLDIFEYAVKELADQAKWDYDAHDERISLTFPTFLSDTDADYYPFDQTIITVWLPDGMLSIEQYHSGDLTMVDLPRNVLAAIEMLDDTVQRYKRIITVEPDH